MRGMRPCIFRKPGEVGVRDEYAERVEDDGCSVLPGAPRVDELAELIKLEVGGNDTADMPMQRRAQGDHRRADAERGIRCRNESPARLHRVAIPVSLSC